MTQKTLLEPYKAGDLTTRDGSDFEIINVVLNPISEVPESYEGTVTLEGKQHPMTWNMQGSAMGAVQVATGNPQQPYQMMQARQVDLVLKVRVGEYKG